MIRLRTSARSCCGGSGSSSTCKRMSRASTSSRVSPAVELRRPLGDARVDVARELGERGREPDPALGAVERGERALHQSLRPARELVGVGGIEAQQVHRDAVRQDGRVRRHEIEGVGRERREQRGRGLGDERFGRMDDLRRHRGDHDPAHRRVPGRVELARAAGPRTGCRRPAPSFPTRSRRCRCRAAAPGPRRSA